MDLLAMFDGSKPFKKTFVPLPSHRKVNPTDMSALDKELSASVCSITTGGTDYVDEYVKEEEERLLKEINPFVVLRGKDGDNFEQVSQGTIPVHHDLRNEELTKVYSTYEFAYRPKANLTILSLANKIVSMVETNQVTVIQGPTGCGKTTQVPQFILDSCYRNKVHCNIIVTQPRRIAAISIAKRVSQERAWPCGSLVGFQVGMVNNTSRDTRLTYCTTGVLLHKLINTKNMLDFTHVIIDEVHERDQEMDFLLLVVRKLLRTNSRSVKVILMSATFNVDKFSNYFSMPAGNQLLPAKVIDVAKSKFFQVHVHYLNEIQSLGPLPEVSEEEPTVSAKMMDFCVRMLMVFDTVDRDTGHRYGVLIFLPGIWEIEEMHRLMTTEEKEPLLWDVVVLHSSITNEEQQRIFENPPSDHRRIILATNIAESSLTVPDVKYVVDFCLTKQLVTDPKTNFQCLELGWASKANCEQRAGRAGRLMDGRVYRLVPETFFELALMEEGAPEMLRAPLENVVLSAKLLDMGEPKAILALSMDPPDLSNLERTILLLKEAGALLNKKDDELCPLDGDLTDLGRVMAVLPVDIHISKLIVLGHIFSVLRETTIMGASMAVKNMFSAPFQKKLEAYSAKLSWADNSNSDCISFLHVYNLWMHAKANQRVRSDAAEKQWARANFIQIRVLREIEALVHDLTMRLRRMGITETVGANRVVWEESEVSIVLKVVIAGAFYPNYFTKCTNIDETAGIRALGGLDPTRTIYLQGWPTNQPGALYAKAIQQYFRGCVNQKVGKIFVTFDKSSRICVQFRKKDANKEKGLEMMEEPGQISLAVYKAVKLRGISSALEIPLLNSEEANRRAERLNIVQPASRIFFPVQNDNEDKVETVKRPDKGIRSVLPGLDESYIPLVIGRIVSPGHFWAHLKDEVTFQQLGAIDSAINSENSSSLKDFDKAPEVGSLVIAPRTIKKKTRYYRAVVEEISVQVKTDLLARVLFIDNGNVGCVRVCDLQQLANEELANIPALAFECVLSEIRPAVLNNFCGQWSPRATEEFHNLLSGDVALFGQVYSVVNSIVNLKLIRVEGDEKLVINDYLVEKGFAAPKEEDYLSRCNHDLRQNCLDLPLKLRRHHEELQHDQCYMSDLYPDPPDVEECSSSVRLRGPFSPLEIGLNSLTRSGIGKRVAVDINSVNSVVLDMNPDDPHERLMVAGSVNQNFSGNKLNLRNTTLMPNIPGLTSLLCLIFTPQMELRRSFVGSRYIGALCGLGYHPTTETALFPEHDLSIYFDVDITIDDIQDVNRLRHWMSMGIFVDSESNDNTELIATCQNRVKDLLFTILNKQRPAAEKRDTDIYFDRWCRYHKDFFIPPGSVVTMKENIFRLHNALDLEEKNDMQEGMLAHMEELRELAARHYRNYPNCDVVCKFCDSQISGVFQLRIHLNSGDHKFNEQKYKRLN